MRESVRESVCACVCVREDVGDAQIDSIIEVRECVREGVCVGVSV